ncbi:MAG: hypothetical protein IH595_06915 [Bacteroidales bacterium]|nr:hypothetical protein [Bacteroidales bacterium]
MQNAALKSSALADSSHMTFQFRSINNLKYDEARHLSTTVFDSAGGLLTKITAVRKGNVRLGIKEKRVVIWTTPEQFDDLLYMGIGMMADLVILPVPPGTYDYVIVDVSDGWAAKDGKVYPVIFPENRMILHFDPAVIVGEQLSPDLVFNIDVSHSFVPVKGRSAYIFKPVVQVQNVTTSGSLSGWVYDQSGNPVLNALVYVNIDGNMYPTYTFSQPYVDPLGVVYYPGQYWIPGIPAGTYTAYAEKDGYVSDSTQVSILKGNFYYQNFVLKSK